MLEHADRHDPMETASNRPIIGQIETHAVRQSTGFGDAAGAGMLLLGKGDAEHVGDPRGFGEIAGEPSPATADIEHAMIGLEPELAGNMPLLGGLGFGRRLRPSFSK